ncbi:MAG: AAA family ATPase [Bacilli bacterium]|nr:AAA family ATPase [Bacilli bacterium]
MASNDENPRIRFIVSGLDNFDPRMLEFLPPELRDKLQKEIGGGNPIPTLAETEPVEEKPKEKIKFDYNMVNCNQNLKELTTKLKASNHTDYNILLYGEAGCGKSYYGQFLAQELGMPVIKKRASDLIDKFVGST